MNLRSVNGKASLEGPTVCLGAEEMYAPVCYQHFCEKIVEATGGPIDFAAAWVAGDKADAVESKKGGAVEELNWKLLEAGGMGRYAGAGAGVRTLPRQVGIGERGNLSVIMVELGMGCCNVDC
eukprot:s958_g6.t1